MSKVKWDVSTDEAVDIIHAFIDAAAMEDKELKILDVGGALKPLAYATTVMDIIPYDNRGWYGHIPESASIEEEAFNEDSWLVYDICETPWPFEDDEFDIVFCTQTIEDVRDPIAVLKEISRVGKCGYISTIHRAFESLTDVNGPDIVGYMHHRWLIEPDGDQFKFVFKTPLLIREEYRPAMVGKQILGCWWTGGISGYEKLFISEQEIVEDLTAFAQMTKNYVNVD